MRIAFFGTGEVAVPSLRQLAARGHSIVYCVTQPDRPKGRGLKPAPSPVKRAAAELRLPVEDASEWTLLTRGLDAQAPDVGVAIDYGRILPSTVLRLPREGMFGVHPSLLPKYRGSSPVASAILAGETATGVTIFRLNERMDAGDIAAQETLPIGPSETTVTATERLAAMGAEQLCRVFERLSAGTLRLAPQDDRQATVTRKFEKADGRIEWAKPAETIDRLVRALQPWPGAWTAWKGSTLKIFAAPPLAGAAAPATPGRVLEATTLGVVVAAGAGAVRIEELQPAGKRRMSAREFLSGHRIEVGEVLGVTSEQREG